MTIAIPQACHSDRFRLPSSIALVFTLAFGCSGGNASKAASDALSSSDGDVTDVPDSLEDAQPFACGGATCQPAEYCVTAGTSGVGDIGPEGPSRTCIAVPAGCTDLCDCFCHTPGCQVFDHQFHCPVD